jgi:hypothetical protein
MNFYTHEELNEIGFASVGQNVLISRNAKFYNPQNIKQILYFIPQYHHR